MLLNTIIHTIYGVLYVAKAKKLLTAKQLRKSILLRPHNWWTSLRKKHYNIAVNCNQSHLRKVCVYSPVKGDAWSEQGKESHLEESPGGYSHYLESASKLWCGLQAGYRLAVYRPGSKPVRNQSEIGGARLKRKLWEFIISV